MGKMGYRSPESTWKSNTRYTGPANPKTGRHSSNSRHRTGHGSRMFTQSKMTGKLFSKYRSAPFLRMSWKSETRNTGTKALNRTGYWITFQRDPGISNPGIILISTKKTIGLRKQSPISTIHFLKQVLKIIFSS